MESGRNRYSSDAGFLENNLIRIKKTMEEEHFETAELHVTQWGFSLSSRNILNDSCFHGAYIMKNLLQNIQHAKLIGYWQGTDLYSDSVDTGEVLFGGSGFLTKNGICKPAFYAYQFLNELGEYLIAQNENAVITWDGINTYHICCHNYKHFGYRYYLQGEDQIQFQNQNQMFENLDAMQMEFDLEGIVEGTYQIEIREVDEQKGNIQYEWGKLGYCQNLNPTEVEYLQQRSQPELRISEVKVCDNHLHISTRLNGNAIQYIVIKEV